MPLSVRDVSFAYRRARPVLSGVSLELEPGRITSIVGPNGSGKSTLLRLMLARLSPTSGQVRLDDRPIAHLSARARAQRLAYVPQHATLAFRYSVEQVVRFGLLASGRAASDALIRRALERADIAERARDPFAQLSAGQRQRVTLARAVAQLTSAPPDAPRVLLADEPSASMDPRHALACVDLLRELASDGVAIALVIHDLSLARRAAHHALLLDEHGRPAALGDAGQVITPDVLAPVFGVRFAALRADSDAQSTPAIVPITTMDRRPGSTSQKGETHELAD